MAEQAATKQSTVSRQPPATDSSADSDSEHDQPNETGNPSMSKVSRNKTSKSIKAPPFWPRNAKRWFIRVEAMFRAERISRQARMYETVLLSLEDEHLEEIDDQLTEHPVPGREYDDLKTALLDAFGIKEEQKTAELFQLTSLGDKTAQSTLRKLRRLTTSLDQVHSALLLSLVPSDIRQMVSAMEWENADQLSKAVDRVLASKNLNAGFPKTAAAIATEVSEDSSVNAVRFSQKKKGAKPKQRQGGENRGGTDRPPTDRENENFVCYYHLRFGTKAFRCEKGCLFASLVKNVTKPSEN